MTIPEIRALRALAAHARDCVTISRGHLRKSKGRKKTPPREHTRGFLEDAERSLAGVLDRLDAAQSRALDDFGQDDLRAEAAEAQVQVLEHLLVELGGDV